MTAKTNKAKQQELRDRRTALGLKRLEVWARPKDFERIRAYVRRLTGAKDGMATD